MVSRAIREIVAENEYGYQNLLAAYTSGAIRLIKAIAKERIVPEINAGSFISKYKLKAASSVNSALRTLTKWSTGQKPVISFTIASLLSGYANSLINHPTVLSSFIPLLFYTYFTRDCLCPGSSVTSVLSFNILRSSAVSHSSRNLSPRYSTDPL